LASLDERIKHLEAELEQLKPSLNERVERLERGLKQYKKIGMRLLEIFGQSLIPIISGGIILLLGYWVKDSVDQALARQQLRLSYVTEMQELIEKMSEPGASRAQIEAAALVLATFGEPAVVPLINELQIEGSVRALAAESGLRAMALTAPSGACKILRKVLDNRTRLYHWKTHQRVIGLLGDIGCKDTLPTLNDYKNMIDNAGKENNLLAYHSILRRDQLPDTDSIEQIQQSLVQTLGVLKNLSDK
jgi:hypothetical protein